ncbi:8-oxo-dGTP diphosphatase [Patescibacteria group bacterium]|nr:8-oxo-dGTP diphosphatase [Patescibacteria group bacterium]
MRQATLCLLIKKNQIDKEILLARKKRGFGAGKWNGIGGKLDSEKGDKNIVEAAIREVEEEIGVKIKEIEKVAVLSFYFPYISDREWDQDVHVFLAKSWEGEPKESEEMLPKWFKSPEIPFAKMWDDDKFWLPQILEGKKLKANFVFKKGEKIAEKDIKFIKNL